jgi:predicted metalloprotease with PDZ domain
MEYRVEVEDASAHLFRVTLILSNAQKNQLFRLPNWIPGSYMIRDFARHIVDFKAYDAEQNIIQFNKVDKSTWQLHNQEGSLKIIYSVYAWDLSVRGAHLDQTHAFFNGTSLFLEPVGFADSPCELIVEKPQDAFASAWSVATSMTPVSISEQGFGRYSCVNYDELIDHPFEIGHILRVDFQVLGVPHELVFQGISPEESKLIDFERIKRDVAKLCGAAVQLFGELPRCVNKYVFLITVLPQGYGGLEHRSSTALHCSQFDLILKKQKKKTDEYINFLTLCCHEYFHTWNVKQIKPAVFSPYDLQSENYTQQLWIFEGFTSYYEDRLAYLSGVITEEEYLKLLAQVTSRVERGRGQLFQSVAESSFDAWTRFYMQDQNAPNAIVSYYTKGKLIALCLDLTLRQISANQYSLDDVMIYLWEHFGKVGRGLKEGELERILNNTFNLDLDATLYSWVYDKSQLPLKALLYKAGIEVVWRSVKSYKTLTSHEDETEVNLGATVKPHSLGAEIVTVYHGSNAHAAGLSTGDCVVAVNHRRVDASSIESVICRYSPGDLITFHAFRYDRLMNFTVELKQAEKNTCHLNKCDNKDSISIYWLTKESK